MKLNYTLSFSDCKESERTKHVHRLHPYKGKFIPQLVEYFLDSHIDDFKKEVYFKPGDIVLDLFCGSGTTLVQANELGIHAVGIEVSPFGVLLSNVKVKKHDLNRIQDVVKRITIELNKFQRSRNVISFDANLSYLLSVFNKRNFINKTYKLKLDDGYIRKKESEFLQVYYYLVNKYEIKVEQDEGESFLDKWFLYPVREEIDFVISEIRKIDDEDIRNVVGLILSRVVRSCRATTHSDLATLKKPITAPYYCRKHYRICKPLFTINYWWNRYVSDTLRRLQEFDRIRTDTIQVCLLGDSREIDIYKSLLFTSFRLADLVRAKKIRGIFPSPPYLGLIDYHEQHAYAYEILGLSRNDDNEIGSFCKGTGKKAKVLYIEGISKVLLNCKKYLQDGYDVFLVVNDKLNIYPQIAELSGMRIVNRFERPVLNRSEKNRFTSYMETIFHLREC